MAGIGMVLVAELGDRVFFLMPGENDVHRHQHREHGEGQYGRPLQEKAKHHKDEADILWVPNVGIGPGHGKPPPMLCVEKYTPGGGDQDETCADEGEAQEMKGPEMRICLPAKHHFKQMSGIMREPVNVWEVALQPPRQKIDGERKAVHFGKQSNKKRAEGAKRTPVSLGRWLEKTEGKENEDRRVEDDQRPETIGACHRGAHCSFPSRSL